MRNPNPSKATASDVAAAAGVSIKSVSRVINDEPHVTPRLRMKVEAAIAALNYVPNVAARSLAGHRSFTLSVVFDNPSPHYTMGILSGAYLACRDNGYHLQIDHIEQMSGARSVPQQFEHILRHRGIDGFVLTPPVSDNLDVLELLEASEIPYVRIAPIIELERSPSVWIDDFAAATEVADYLWSHGHRRFGFVAGHPDFGAARLRRDGFFAGLRRHQPGLIIAEAEGGFDFDGGIKAGLELLSSQFRPSAIFAANDDSAAGVLVACHQANLAVPSDISIIGFDDSWVAKSVWPSLSTIRQPIEEMAETAVRIMIDRNLALRVESSPQLKMSYALIERASVARFEAEADLVDSPGS